jgi:hypothetical protein
MTNSNSNDSFHGNWRSIPGYENLYKVSDQGFVKSLDRLVKYPNGKPARYFKGKILKQSLQVSKYYYGLRLSKQGKTKLWLTHQLVALAFMGPTPQNMVICHGPKGSFVNTLDNLSFGTCSKNSFDQWRDGTKKHGEKCSWSKLTSADVLEIKKLRMQGIKNKDIAFYFNISPSRVCDIIKGRGWNHLNNEHISSKRTSRQSLGSP